MTKFDRKVLEDRAVDLLPRLNGIYRVDVNDGCGLLDGKDYYERKFDVPPIMKESSQLIQDQQAHIKELENNIKGIKND